MTAKQYVAALERFDLTPYAAAPVIGVSIRQSLRYASGESAVPESVAKLLRAMAILKELGHDINV